jgi:hypothetical protein
MKFFKNKKKESTIEKIQDKISSIKSLMENNPEMSIMIAFGHSEGGQCLIRGNPNELNNVLFDAAIGNKSFAEVLKITSMRLNLNGSDELMSSDIVDLPGGERAIAIKASGIENISDKDIDDIVDKMFNEMKKKNNGPS